MARSISDMIVQELPVEQWLEASLPDAATDPSLAMPDPAWLKGMANFQVGGNLDGPEFQADLIYSVNGLIR